MNKKNIDIDEYIFALCRYSLNHSTTFPYTIQELPWLDIFNVSKIHGIGGFVSSAFLNLTKDFGCSGSGDILFEELKYKALSNVLVIERKNKVQDSTLRDLFGKWQQDGIHTLLFKGQANKNWFLEPLYRSPGDVDCFTYNNYDKANLKASQYGAKVDCSWFKHSQIVYRGELFENHHYFVHTRSGEWGKNLEQELLTILLTDKPYYYDDTSVQVPSPLFNAIFLTYHALEHFVTEGLRLKQVMDWAAFLQSNSEKVDWLRFNEICRRYRMDIFASAMNDIAIHDLGVNVNNKDIVCTCKLSDRIKRSILNDKDYVFSSGKSAWHNRCHLIFNLFKYRWKYEKVFQISIWRQLWIYAYGYIRKKE